MYVAVFLAEIIDQILSTVNTVKVSLLNYPLTGLLSMDRCHGLLMINLWSEWEYRLVLETDTCGYSRFLYYLASA